MATWSLPPAALALLGAAGVIALLGPRLARTADRLADRTGLGEAVTGALLLGGATSLAGVVTTAVGAAAGDGGFAVSNALGGIAVQTAFIPVADMALRRVNLEHSAASLPNLVQAAFLMTLLSLVLLGAAGPDVDFGGLHPVSFLLVAVYLYGLRITGRAHGAPMWRPEETDETVVDRPAPHQEREPLRRLWARFGVYASVMAVSGWTVAQAGLSIIEATGFTSSEVATLLTGVVTSFPELVVLLAAVRMRAPTLGVANIIGGNTFDTMFMPVADGFFRSGSVYQAVTGETLFVLGLTLALTAVLSAGLLSRQQTGIGFEGVGITVLYVAGVLVLLFAV